VTGPQLDDHRTDAHRTDDELPDPGLFWRWVGRAVRPYVGWILVGAGAIAILIGYLGISREALVAKQMPYLISGGILGLALVAVGTFYLATEELRRDSRRLDRLERMVTQLHAVLLTHPDAPPAEEVDRLVRAFEATGPSGNGHAHPDAPIPGELVALRGSRRFHRANCPMVAGKTGVGPVSATTIREQRMQPCSMCEPAIIASP
jgi:HAMP domain-containing protein